MVFQQQCSLRRALGTVCVLAVVLLLSQLAYLPGHLPRLLPSEVRRLLLGEMASRSSLSSDVSGYDVPEVSRWYSGSLCSGRGSEFVGDQPFFPPCRSDLPPGVATWGKHPYVGPFRFLNNSRNPCWKEGDRLMCIPYFYQIGVSKSGTSDLYYRLTSHPHLIRTGKEPHFFNRRRYDRGRTFRDYIKGFAKVAQVVQTDIWNHGKSNVISGDYTTTYFSDNQYWKSYSGNENCTEPRIILAHHLYHLNPHLKILMIIRHPVHRLYSQYLYAYGKPPLYNKSDPPSPRQFHSWVVEGLKKRQDCFQRWSLRHCVYNTTLHRSMAQVRIQESMYPVLLEDWFRVIPRDQFLFLRFEDYRHDMASQLRRVFDFLGLEQPTNDTLMKMLSSGVRNQGRLVKRTDPMLPETERLLQEFYQPFIRRFAAMLHDNKFLWADVKSHVNQTHR